MTDIQTNNQPSTPLSLFFLVASQVALVVKNLPTNAGDVRDMGPIPELRRSPGEGHGNPLLYSCLENPMDGGVWWATLHRAAKSLTLLKQLSIHGNEIKRHLFFGRKVMTNLDIILNSRDSTMLTRGPYGQSCSFFSSHVQMWELEHKEG